MAEGTTDIKRAIVDTVTGFLETHWDLEEAVVGFDEPFEVTGDWLCLKLRVNGERYTLNVLRVRDRCR